MKKVLVAVFAIALTTGAFAQDSTGTMNNKMSQSSKMNDHSGVMMKDGKVMVMKNGQVSTLTDNLVLDNGTTVMANGTVKMSDGTTSTMQDGDYMKMDGTKGKMKPRMKKADGMDKMTTDSTK